MIAFSQLLDKQLVDKNTAISYGKISNISIRENMAILHCQAGQVVASKIYSVDSVVTATSCNVLDTPLPTVLGKSLFTTKGAPLGIATDIQLTSTLRVKKLLTPQHTITIGKIVGIADVVLTKPLPTPKVAPTAPIRYGNCDWLLGRICYKSIVNYHNEIIVHAGQLISRATINSCKSAYKLRELIVNSK